MTTTATGSTRKVVRKVNIPGVAVSVRLSAGGRHLFADDAPLSDDFLSGPNTGFAERSFSGAQRIVKGMNDVWSGIIWSLAPTVLVGLMFWVVMRSIVRADRTERKAYSKMEAEERARRGLRQKP